MSIFDFGEELMAGALDMSFGDETLITPRIAASRYRDPVPDPGRAAKTIIATFTEAPADDDIRGQTVGSELSGSSRLAGVIADLSISAEQYALLGYDLQKGDLVTLTTKPGHPSYSVTLREPRGSGWMVLLTEEAPT